MGHEIPHIKIIVPVNYNKTTYIRTDKSLCNKHKNNQSIISYNLKSGF